MSFVVSIRHVLDQDDVTIIGSVSTRREAERIERDASINLNHDDYYTAIVEAEASS